MESNELRHYGVLGMKWGRRRATDSSGRVSKIQAGKNAREASKTARKESIANDRASGLSGIGSFRRADLNAKAAMKTARRESLRNDSAHNKQLKEERSRDKQKDWSSEAKSAFETRKKSVNQMTNAELKSLNERRQLEENYSRLNPNKVKKGIAYVAAAAGTMNVVLNLYNNSDKMVATGKKLANAMIKK